MPTFRTASGRPILLEEVLVRHPRLRLFVENAGYPYRDQMIAMMYQYPQLYADVSTITWVIPRTAFYDYLDAFVRAGHAAGGLGSMRPDRCFIDITVTILHRPLREG